MCGCTAVPKTQPMKSLYRLMPQTVSVGVFQPDVGFYHQERNLYSVQFTWGLHPALTPDP